MTWTTRSGLVWRIAPRRALASISGNPCTVNENPLHVLLAAFASPGQSNGAAPSLAAPSSIIALHPVRLSGDGVPHVELGNDFNHLSLCSDAALVERDPAEAAARLASERQVARV